MLLTNDLMLIMPPPSSLLSLQEAIHHHQDQGGLRRRAVPIIGKKARGQPASLHSEPTLILRGRFLPSPSSRRPGRYPFLAHVILVGRSRPNDRSRHVLGRLLHSPAVLRDKVDLLDASRPAQGREPTHARRIRCCLRLRRLRGVGYSILEDITDTTLGSLPSPDY
jgi:hypothetical protein